MNLIRLIDFQLLGDERGSLIAIEQNRDVPFNIHRAYYIFGTKEGVVRGYHAHRNLVQVAVCVKGQCDILMDDGETKEVVTLDSPLKGLLIDVMQWHEMSNFSEDCVLLVLASDVYDESDYIRNYEEFRLLTNK